MQRTMYNSVVRCTTYVCVCTIANGRFDEVAEWLRRWTANPLGSARVGSNPILVEPLRFYGVMVSTLDFESSDPSSNLGRTFPCCLLHSVATVNMFDVAIFCAYCRGVKT